MIPEPSSSPIQHVSDTAFMVAHHRAVESARPDALFVDPLAALLAGERGAAITRGLPMQPMVGWSVAIRTRIIDQYIAGAIAAGCDTVVNLGAGLDTRPYRLSLPPSLRWIEVDYPALITFKDQRLAAETPRCQLVRVGMDLAEQPQRQTLLRQIDGESSRLLIITEGVVPYLDNAAVGALAKDLRALPHAASWIVDYFSPDSTAYRKKTGADRAMAAAPFKFNPPDWFAFFAQHGWQSREVRYLPAEGARLGRRPPLPWAMRAVMKLLRPFAPADKRERFGRFAGIVLLVPTPR
ncbi:MAG TPA: SAM-dependent methyltransferase [Polyangia bacterium]|jgi:methyltransferase (TIGR00027 family)|nr:SAM-dependent methyltransferase [Polyangia bacterium]